MKEDLGWILPYSPYHNVVEGRQYPSVLITAGENDNRVHPMHARKLAALLQRDTKDEAAAPILLWVDREAGHGRGKPMDLRIRDAADRIVFAAVQPTSEAKVLSDESLIGQSTGVLCGRRNGGRSVERLTNVLNEPIYVYHDIVHNRHVVNRFEAKGVVFTEAIETIPRDRSWCSVLTESARKWEQSQGRNLRAVDAMPAGHQGPRGSDPLCQSRLDILLIGHADHQEVIGTRGEAPGEIRVIESEADAEAIEVDDPTKVVYLTQTTLSTDDAGRIITILKRVPRDQSPSWRGYLLRHDQSSRRGR